MKSSYELTMERLDRIELGLKYLGKMFENDHKDMIPIFLDTLLEDGPTVADSALVEDIATSSSGGVKITFPHVEEPIRITAENWMEYWGKEVWDVYDGGYYKPYVLCGKDPYHTRYYFENHSSASLIYAQDPATYLKQKQPTNLSK